MNQIRDNDELTLNLFCKLSFFCGVFLCIEGYIIMNGSIYPINYNYMVVQHF
jgi:hypothetical protein